MESTGAQMETDPLNLRIKPMKRGQKEEGPVISTITCTRLSDSNSKAESELFMQCWASSVLCRHHKSLYKVARGRKAEFSHSFPIVFHGMGSIISCSFPHYQNSTIRLQLVLSALLD